MAKKKKLNPIIAEQRRARQEFLELKKMQSGELAPEPKPSEEAIVPKTFSQKVQNYWYHYKWATLIGLFIAVVIAVCVVQCVKRVEPDLQIMVYGHHAISEEGIADLAEQYCSDLNGDGKVKVQIINCSYNEDGGNPEYAMTMRQKLTCMLNESNTLLFIVDQSGYDDYLKNLSGKTSLFEGEPQPLNQLFYDHSKQEDQNLLILCRDVEHSALKREKGAQKNYKASQKILRALTETAPQK